MSKKKKERVAKQKFSLALMWKQRYLLLMSVPFLIWLIIFKVRTTLGLDDGIPGGKAKFLRTSDMGAEICRL